MGFCFGGFKFTGNLRDACPNKVKEVIVYELLENVEPGWSATVSLWLIYSSIWIPWLEQAVKNRSKVLAGLVLYVHLCMYTQFIHIHVSLSECKHYMCV